MEIIQKWLDIIFPSKCFYCQKVGKVICDNCFQKLNDKYLFQKINHDWFDYVFCGSFYRDVLRTRIHSFKFHEQAYLYQYFIVLSLREKKIIEFLKEYDYITYVPMHYQKEQKRGYNQSKLLALELGKRLNLKVVSVLEKRKPNRVQSSLSERERIKNVRNIFSFQNTIDVKNKSIILVDDILTTGATVRACSKVLKEQGVQKICVFTISKT